MPRTESGLLARPPNFYLFKPSLRLARVQYHTPDPFLIPYYAFKEHADILPRDLQYLR